MPTTYDMSKDDDLFRMVWSYEYTPGSWDYSKGYGQHAVFIPSGPPTRHESMIGPYRAKKDIKSWITRNRKGYTNFKIERIERVSAWEEVDL